MKSFFLPFAFLLLLISSSCKKDPVISKPITKTLFTIKLDQQYFGSSGVDSAFVTWETNGLSQKILLEKSNDSLIAQMDQFNEGTGKLSLKVFSNKKFRNQYKTQFIGIRDASLQKTKAINFNGPTSLLDMDWKPRVELWDVIGHSAIIGVRPDDPYFLVKDVKAEVIKLTVDKSFWKGLNMAGQGIFECRSGCSGNIENSTAFSHLPGQIGSKEWNHIEIYVLYEKSLSGEGWVLSLTHDL